ncbi:Fis family transcriptional regulator [Pseudoalteromonas sp. SMS1]|uniref:Fis family transcriptional regulator n=1 Tax=Pseudoalteromonas sp. SMS1 TaxID=2908894 RepID=UPI001F3EE7C3|nr:Fis family transcriptional regulator [Pseudoalteromonas sp. SMS1]MCF2860141.1 Fis family transcriptional regulator [Pseudoalteromonas sp. SMS1]
MRKSDKKLEKTIVSALTEACEEVLKLYEGFEWLTHFVNFQTFPDSLSIVCVFNCNMSLQQVIEMDKGERIKTLIERKLTLANVKAKGIKKRIVFDTEEACQNEHNGNWNKRFEDIQNARFV